MAYTHVDTGSNPVFDKIEFMWCEEHLQLLIVLNFVWTFNYELLTILFLNSFGWMENYFLGIEMCWNPG